MCFYDKQVYFFYNECADSSKSHWELKLFSWKLVYQNTFSIYFYEHYKYRVCTVCQCLSPDKPLYTALWRHSDNISADINDHYLYFLCCGFILVPAIFSTTILGNSSRVTGQKRWSWNTRWHLQTSGWVNLGRKVRERIFWRVLSQDSNQPAHSYSLIGLSCLHEESLHPWLYIQKCAQWRFWSVNRLIRCLWHNDRFTTKVEVKKSFVQGIFEEEWLHLQGK